MCGIVGTIGAAARPPDLFHLQHRGPDAQGALPCDLGWARAFVGATQLAIVEAGVARPMPATFPRLGATVALNGEVYNWRALRDEIGGEWGTETDTEVVAAAWRRWGPAMLDRLNGMFALAVVDVRDRRVMLARDRGGEKPLYWTAEAGVLRFASEAKALGVELREAPCPEVRALEFDCLDATPFAGVRMLSPGQRILLDGARGLRHPTPETWWSPPAESDESMRWEWAVERCHELVVDATRIRADLHVPAGLLVSGGLDSAIVQKVARLPRVYCCWFPEADCREAAALAADGAEIEWVAFGLADAERAIEKIAYHLDTPAPWSAIALWFLAERMAEDGVRAVLSGEGADELFGGYSRYRILWWLDRMRADPALSRYGPAIGNALASSGLDVLARMLDRGDVRHSRFLCATLGGTGDLVRRMSRVDWFTTMQVLFRMADRMMAAFSIENRSPFMDHRLVELAFTMPTRWKVTPDASKAVLREVARRLGVADAIINATHKTGLVVPWNAWRQVEATSPRGPWDRSDFRDAMLAAWRRAFRLAAPP